MRKSFLSIFQIIWWLFLPPQRRLYLSLWALMGFGAGLEMVGMALLLPLLALMAQPDLITQQAVIVPLTPVA